MTYSNKVIWITGASSGIGEAMAQDFAREGAQLILSSRKEGQLNLVKEKCESLGASKVLVVPMDLAKHDLIPDIVNKTIGDIGQIDVLINNGGISQRSLVNETGLEVDKRIFDVNYFGAVAMTKALLPKMLEQNSGSIVAISSVAGKFSTPGRSAYCGSKHAMQGFFDALRFELKDTDIKVTVICPGYIKTNISINALAADGSNHGKMDDGQAAGMPVEKFSQKAIHAIRLGRDEVVIGGFETIGVYLKRFLPRVLKAYINNTKVT